MFCYGYYLFILLLYARIFLRGGWDGRQTAEYLCIVVWGWGCGMRIQKSFQILQVWSLENLIDGQISFGVFISWRIIIVNALQDLKKQPCLLLKRSLGVEASSVSIKLKVQLGLSLTYSRIGTESTVVIMMWAYALLQGKIFSSEITTLFQILLKMPCVEFILIQIGPI